MFSEAKVPAVSSVALGGKVQVCTCHSRKRVRRLTSTAVLGLEMLNSLAKIHTKQTGPDILLGNAFLQQWHLLPQMGSPFALLDVQTSAAFPLNPVSCAG